jgi:hypothetical protein
MPIIVVPDATTSAQSIVDCTSQDVRALLGTSGGDAGILLDFIDKVQLRMLRESRWEFLLSAPKYFVTEAGQVDYWLGPTGTQPYGIVDTGLDLDDVYRIKEDSVWDRSHFRLLKKTMERLPGPSLVQRDLSPREAAPAVFRHDRAENANILSLYPPAKADNTYAQVPLTPVMTGTGGGALSARTYFVKVTFVDSAAGESAPSPAARQFIPASALARVASPRPLFTNLQSGIQITHFNVYVGTAEGSETKQNASPISIGSAWTEPAGGLIAGAALPTTSTLEPMRGNLIEFRYYKDRSRINAVGDILDIPDEYSDIVCAGVNYYATKYLKMWDDAQAWGLEFRDGLRQMIRDKNLHPHGPDFVRADPAAYTTSSGWPSGLGPWTQDSF